MALPWVRLDSSIASHDKILALLSDPSPKRWQAAFSYVCALGWSGHHGTDGRIPTTALPMVHGTKATAELLIKYHLWNPVTAGYEIRNFAERQVLAWVGEAARQAKSKGAAKGNHERWHAKRGVTDPECPYCNGSKD